MADSVISALPAAAQPSGSELVVLVQAGVTVQTTLAKALAASAVLGNIYSEGVWTPTFTSLTVVLGGGGVLYNGKWTRVGNLVHWEVQLTVTGGATTHSVAGTTFINNMPFTIISTSPTCEAADGAVTSLGIGVGAVGTKTMFPPTWAANSNSVYVAGSYFTDGT